MKRLAMLIFTCFLTSIPANSVDRIQTVRVMVSAQEGETLIEGYLKREIDKLQGFEVAPTFKQSSKYADWQLAVVGVRMGNGVYAIAISIVKNRYMKPYLRDSLTPYTKKVFEVIPEHYTTLIHTGFDLETKCKEIVVVAENHMRR